jgi:hypothetical protein
MKLFLSNNYIKFISANCFYKQEKNDFPLSEWFCLKTLINEFLFNADLFFKVPTLSSILLKLANVIEVFKTAL